ncbi:DUF6188 family protein [Amycolatopsis sp.]|uniref:DUF6188 family protein n=1 Tax=Amycolatopsis sp. TaxID=37632 RepID=UPI0039C89C2D
MVTGARLRIESDSSYDAWAVSGPNGNLVVCIPGGELAIGTRRSTSSEHFRTSAGPTNVGKPESAVLHLGDVVQATGRTVDQQVTWQLPIAVRGSHGQGRWPRSGTRWRPRPRSVGQRRGAQQRPAVVAGSALATRRSRRSGPRAPR